MKRAAARPGVAITMLIMAIMGLAVMTVRVADRAAEDAVGPLPPIEIIDLAVEPNASKPVYFSRVARANADGVWRVTYWRIGDTEPLCQGSGASNYLISEPEVMRYSHSEWSGYSDCDAKVAATSPGTYVMDVEWTLTVDSETSTIRRLVPFRID